ncbi:hypothetical protein B0H16DRAFT_1452587 [Mycena metata]|uniref:Uncharacterized protein n=1 Tax=Mycena metata TaxID=1033252 RepID=A0AAD7JSL1_9AGAR|nr:hypothetical protein B0H16DRAFT_1452587 [Mycena metata]
MPSGRTTKHFFSAVTGDGCQRYGSSCAHIQHSVREEERSTSTQPIFNLVNFVEGMPSQQRKMNHNKKENIVESPSMTRARIERAAHCTIINTYESFYSAKIEHAVRRDNEACFSAVTGRSYFHARGGRVRLNANGIQSDGCGRQGPKRTNHKKENIVESPFMTRARIERAAHCNKLIVYECNIAQYLGKDNKACFCLAVTGGGVTSAQAGTSDSTPTVFNLMGVEGKAPKKEKDPQKEKPSRNLLIHDPRPNRTGRPL